MTVVGLNATPREADLAGMSVQIRRPLGEQYVHAVVALDQGHKDSGMFDLLLGKDPILMPEVVLMGSQELPRIGNAFSNPGTGDVL
jgi:hypothetical protein